MMSSTYARHISKFNPLNAKSIRHRNVATALQSLNGVVLNLYILLLVMNAVLSASSVAKATWWNPLLKSNVQNQQLLFIASRHWSVRGNGYASFRVISLTWRKSMQHLTLPSFFFARTMFDAYGIAAGSMTP